MKKVLLVFLAVIIVFGLVGCNKEKVEEKDALTKIKEKGELVIGTSPDYPPFEFIQVIDGKETPVGFEMSVAKEIADTLGVKLVIKTMDFDGVIQSVKDGQIDLAVSGLTPTAKREKVVDFTNIFFTGKQTALIHKDNADKIKSAADLKGKVLGAQMGSIQFDLADTLGGKEVKVLKATDALALEVSNKHIDALIVSDLAAKKFAENIKDVTVAPFTFESNDEGVAIALAKGNPKLKAQINGILKNLKENGQLDKFYTDAESIVVE
ncbi:MAG: putative amino acid transporter [Bacillales bacterium]|jgi:polar amino acid transport system substrate-binding protein|nr:putative amino acid transporter [Bacillales bacterium]